MMQRGKRVKTDLDAMDKMAAMLRHALEDAEDIFDDAQHKIVLRCWHRLCGAFAACIALCKSSCVSIARIVRTNSARLLQWARDISLSLFLLRRSEEPVPVNISAAVSDEHIRVTIDIPASDDEPDPVATGVVAYETVRVTTGAAVSDEPDPVTTSAKASDDEPDPVTTPSDSSERWLSCLCSSFDFFKNCCTSLYNWLVHAIDFARFYRDWSYDVVGITSYQENATALDFVLAAISRWKLKKRIEKVESTVTEVKKSPLLGVARNSTPNDTANKNRSRIGAASKRKVFGREVLRDDIMARLRETPQGDAPSSNPCYSVIGIYGVAGSGKTTFAGYIRDYIKEECKEKPFDTIMCIHVSETFSVDDIFHEMLKDITKDRHSNISDREELEEKLKEALRGKRFFLILDDLWVKNKNDPQLEELIYPLNCGLKGSKILVTARTKDAAGALCADKPIKMPDLDEDQYSTMFMHYALSGTRVADEEFLPVGRVIAKKLHRSPIAAVTVAGQLGANPNISFWKNIAELDMFNDTMDALWWSYQQLNPDIRRCLEYCNIFPRRVRLDRDKLVCLWIAQGFVKTSCAAEDMEDVAEVYIQELVSCSFLQPEGDYFTIHDLLHDLADKVAGSDFFRIENERSQRGEGWKGDVPRDVRHLFVQNYDAELITEKILGLENLRTLIVERDTPVEENAIESICKRLLKLRVLDVAFSGEHFIIKFSVPESISQLKHLRYLAFPTRGTAADLVNLRHIIDHGRKFHNITENLQHIGKLISLQTIPAFTVRNEQGYEIKQLRDLNKLRGSLLIYGLENVKSKEEALEANLAAKERLRKLDMAWDGADDTRCSPEVEAEVLEGLYPPMGLQTLQIKGYKGSRYPDWMLGNQNGGPKDLRGLFFSECSQLGPAPELEAFPHLRVLRLSFCSWDSLPGNMEHLTSLKKLEIIECLNIRSLPTLPRSLEEFRLWLCNDEFMKSCQTDAHPYWHKIKHIPLKTFHPHIPLPISLKLDFSEVKQLRDINKLRDNLVVYGLENVKSKEEALEANLAAKEGLTELSLQWGHDDDRRCSPEVEAEVLEGMCPPVGLQRLGIYRYKGSRYPDWMVGKQSGGPKDLQQLDFCDCSQLASATELEAFVHLRVLLLWNCSWDSLPGNMEQLTLLKKLAIYECVNIHSLPTLPQSLEEFLLYFSYDEFMQSCQTAGHPNWQKIEHVPNKKFIQKAVGDV